MMDVKNSEIMNDRFEMKVSRTMLDKIKNQAVKCDISVAEYIRRLIAKDMNS